MGMSSRRGNEICVVSLFGCTRRVSVVVGGARGGSGLFHWELLLSCCEVNLPWCCDLGERAVCVFDVLA